MSWANVVVAIASLAALLGVWALINRLPAEALAVQVLVDWQLWGRPVVLTTELLQVSGFLAALSGLHFTVCLVTDAAYRRGFFEQVLGELRRALAMRAVYLAVRHPTPGTEGTSESAAGG